MRALELELELVAPVLGPARLIMAGRGGTLFSIRLGLDAGASHALRDEVLLGGVRAAIAQSQVVLVRSTLISITLDGNVLDVPALEAAHALIQAKPGIGADRGGVEVEEYGRRLAALLGHAASTYAFVSFLAGPGRITLCALNTTSTFTLPVTATTLRIGGALGAAPVGNALLARSAHRIFTAPSRDGLATTAAALSAFRTICIVTAFHALTVDAEFGNGFLRDLGSAMTVVLALGIIRTTTA